MRTRIVVLIFAAVTLVGVAHAGDDPTPHSIIDRALKAGGGAEKIGEFKAVSFKAEAMSNGKKATLTGLFAAPTLFRLEMKSEDDEPTLLIGGGDTFWLKTGKEAIKEISGKDEMDAALPIFHALTLPNRLLSLKAKEYKLTILGDQAVNGVQAVAMRITHRLYPDALLYFDKETGLPVKSQVKCKIDYGLFAKQTEHHEFFFDEYKEIDGVKHFTKLKLRAGEEIIEFELRDLKLHKKVDAGAFKKPG